MAKYIVRPKPPEPKRPRRSIGSILAKQALGLIGFGCIGLALAYVWYAKTYPPHRIFFAPVEVLIAVGIVLIGVWALTT